MKWFQNRDLVEVKAESAGAERSATTMTQMHEKGLDESVSSPPTPTIASSPTSDADLENRVRVFLAGLKVPGLRGVTVDVEGGVARACGEVQTFHEKQLATHCCQRVAGVVRVINNVHVAPRSSACSSSAGRRPA